MSDSPYVPRAAVMRPARPLVLVLAWLLVAAAVVGCADEEGQEGFDFTRDARSGGRADVTPPDRPDVTKLDVRPDCDPDAAGEERCNGVDDDCDGETDEGFDDLGDVCDADADGCADGVRACNEDGDAVVCQPEPGAFFPEQCNGVDDDCDGDTDEDWPTLGDDCRADDDPVCPARVMACAADGGSAECVDDAAGTGEPELCNAMDDDCDGETDEGFAVGLPCDSDADGCADGLGACSADGSALECVPSDEPFDELCNGLDDDCDGETDEGFGGLGDACDGDDGDLCEDGELICSADGAAVVCGDEAPEGDELCNGLDDDCDGETDEDFTGLGEACDGGDADLCEDGVRICSQDGSAVACAEELDDNEEVCNGLDDDCDGETDEDFPEVCEAVVVTPLAERCERLELVLSEHFEGRASYLQTDGQVVAWLQTHQAAGDDVGVEHLFWWAGAQEEDAARVVRKTADGPDDVVYRAEMHLADGQAFFVERRLGEAEDWLMRATDADTVAAPIFGVGEGLSLRGVRTDGTSTVWHGQVTDFSAFGRIYLWDGTTAAPITDGANRVDQPVVANGRVAYSERLPTGAVVRVATADSVLYDSDGEAAGAHSDPHFIDDQGAAGVIFVATIDDNGTERRHLHWWDGTTTRQLTTAAGLADENSYHADAGRVVWIERGVSRDDGVKVFSKRSGSATATEIYDTGDQGGTLSEVRVSGDVVSWLGVRFRDSDDGSGTVFTYEGAGPDATALGRLQPKFGINIALQMVYSAVAGPLFALQGRAGDGQPAVAMGIFNPSAQDGGLDDRLHDNDGRPVHARLVPEVRGDILSNFPHPIEYRVAADGAIAWRDSGGPGDVVFVRLFRGCPEFTP